MFVIQNSQFNALSAAQEQKTNLELEHCVHKKYPEFAKATSEDEIATLCSAICKLGTTHGIYKITNLELLLQSKIEFDFEINEELSTILKNNKLTEDQKSEKYYLTVASGRAKLKRITLSNLKPNIR